MRKDDPRVAAYGDVDELNAALGVVLAHSSDAGLNRFLKHVQRDLFALGAQLADPRARIGKKRAKAAFAPALVRSLENEIDAVRLRPHPWEFYMYYDI